MRRWLFRLLLLVPVILTLLAVAAYYLVDAWLESAGGRRALEASLGERLGVPVSLAGEFNVMLLPRVGVDGTDLFIGAPGEATEIAYGREYAVALALRPLFDGQLVVESVYLSGGRFYPERWPAGEGGAEHGVITPPEIRRLEIEDIAVATGDGDRLNLTRLRIDDFRADVDTPFELAAEGYGDVEGTIRWNSSSGSLSLAGEWTGWLPGRTRIEAQVGFGDGSGSLAANWDDGGAAADAGERLAARFDYALAEGGVRVEGLRLEAGEQFVDGAGCVRFDEPARMDFELQTPRIDLDSLPDFGPFIEAMGAGEEGATEAVDAPGAGTALNLRLRAGQALGQGAVAYDAMFLLGNEPDCRERSD